MMVVDERTCPKCPSQLLVGGAFDRPFWVCPGCHMAYLSPALMGQAETPLLQPS